MTTYNETKFSVSRVSTDLQLFFELTQNTYTQDPDFAERWNDYLVNMVSDRLWKYSEVVMTNELGNEKYNGSLDSYRGEGGVHYTLREAFVLFAKTSDINHPQIWKDGEWVDEEEVVIYMILENGTLTTVDEEPDMDEYEIESDINCDEGHTEVTYKKKGSNEIGVEEEEEESRWKRNQDGSWGDA